MSWTQIFRNSETGFKWQVGAVALLAQGTVVAGGSMVPPGQVEVGLVLKQSPAEASALQSGPEGRARPRPGTKRR